MVAIENLMSANIDTMVVSSGGDTWSQKFSRG
jgi:hypothetical protein